VIRATGSKSRSGRVRAQDSSRASTESGGVQSVSAVGVFAVLAGGLAIEGR
jgi:hypothetical protein